MTRTTFILLQGLAATSILLAASTHGATAPAQESTVQVLSEKEIDDAIVIVLALSPAPSRAGGQTTPPSGGKWKISTTKNPMDDRPIVTATLKAEAGIEGWLSKSLPDLIIRCQTPSNGTREFPDIMPVQPGLEMYVVTGMPATVENAEGKHMVRVRFDDQPAQQIGTSESTDHNALFFAPFFTTKFIVTHGTLSSSKQLLVQFTPFNASPVIIKFDTRGFAVHEHTVLSACPQVDQSKWRFPPGQEPRRRTSSDPSSSADSRASALQTTAPSSSAGVIPASTLLTLSRDEVLHQLGKPNAESDDRIVYIRGDGRLFTISFTNGRVTTVSPADTDLRTVGKR